MLGLHLSMLVATFTSKPEAREAIETHLAEQRVEKEHRANHRHLEGLAEQRLDLQQSYDRFGRKTNADRPQGTKLNIEV